MLNAMSKTQKTTWGMIPLTGNVQRMQMQRDRKHAAHCSLVGLREGDGLDHQEGMKHFSLGMMTVFKNQMEGVVAA